MGNAPASACVSGLQPTSIESQCITKRELSCLNETVEAGDDFDKDYSMHKKLGEGTYGQVFLCIHRAMSKKRAVKIVDISNLDKDDRANLEMEIDILKELRHPNILHLYHVYRKPTDYYLVETLCAGGELFDRIVEKRHYSERDARQVVKLLLDAFCYLHSKGVAHRDLKPENILLSDEHDDISIKIADFGLAKKCDDDKSCKTLCGSPGYIAPEILKEERYGTKSDLWSMGTIIYIILAGFHPFDNRSQLLMLAKIKKGIYTFRAPFFDHVSEDAKSLIKHMLVTDPKKRLTAQACLQHRWFHLDEQDLAQNCLSGTKERLKEFKARRHFKGAVEAVMMANRLSISSGKDFLSGTISHSFTSETDLSLDGSLSRMSSTEGDSQSSLLAPEDDKGSMKSVVDESSSETPASVSDSLGKSSLNDANVGQSLEGLTITCETKAE